VHDTQRTYLPAAGCDWALPLYDPLLKLLGTDAARQKLLDQAALNANHRVLDIGCGTGTLVIRIKRLHPQIDIVGLDPDPKALARAAKKAAKARVSIPFDRGFSDQMPYPAASFDRVFSSLMFHHIEPDDREKTLREVRRVLKPGGSLHLLDFAGADAPGTSWLGRWAHSAHRMKDLSADRVVAFMNAAGLIDAQKVSDGTVLFGQLRVSYYRASAPARLTST
jgi:ubiquinone/menaquinone biosynthesis C-methylase UbiE